MKRMHGRTGSRALRLRGGAGRRSRTTLVRLLLACAAAAPATWIGADTQVVNGTPGTDGVDGPNPTDGGPGGDAQATADKASDATNSATATGGAGGFGGDGFIAGDGGHGGAAIARALTRAG